MPQVRQCPQCELRFTNANELEDHLARDHPRSQTEVRENPDEQTPRPSTG
jgi:hypothetical protein